MNGSRSNVMVIFRNGGYDMTVTFSEETWKKLTASDRGTLTTRNR